MNSSYNQSASSSRPWIGGSSTTVPFGLKEGRLWFVSEVEIGLGCGCVCPDPACNKALIAANRPSPDRKRVYHFKHASRTASCGGRESALHRMAKEVLLRADSIALPAWIGPDLEIAAGVLDLEAGARQEVRILNGQLRPDVQVSGVRESALLPSLSVEIKVRHAVDWQKAETVRRQGITMLEIDLSSATDEEVQDSEAFSRLVLDKLDNRAWIHIGDPAFLAAMLDHDVIEVRSTDTFPHHVKAKSGNTMHFAKQRAIRYRRGELPVDFDFEIEDLYRDSQRIDGMGNNLPYQPGLYVSISGRRRSNFAGYDSNYFKTYLQPLIITLPVVQQNLFDTR